MTKTKQHDFDGALEYYQNSRAPDYMGVHNKTIIHALKLADALDNEPSDEIMENAVAKNYYTDPNRSLEGDFKAAFKEMINQLKKEIEK